MPTKEEKVAKQKAANDKARVRALMIAGKVAEAEAYAAERGFDVFAARLAPEYQNAAEPMFAALEAARKVPVNDLATSIAILHDKMNPTIDMAEVARYQKQSDEMANATLMDIDDEAPEPEAVLAAPNTIQLNITPHAMPDWTKVPPPDIFKTEMAPETINGWPVLTEAVVWGFPPNRGLVVIELPDKRRVSMWRTRNIRYRIFDRLRARIVKTEGDPIYEEVMGPRAVF